jgi:hypothetical protein
VKLQIIITDNKLIYTDQADDPYSDATRSAEKMVPGIQTDLTEN